MAKMRSSGKLDRLTRQYYNQLAAVVYAQLFGYPLTVSEAKLWAIRKIREERSDKLERVALAATSWLKKIPLVQAVFLTGSVATRNATGDADADLMIITSPNALWLTRLITFLPLKRTVCPNIFLDTNHLEIPDKNLFTAHEVLQTKCLYDRGGVEKKWLEVNAWTKEYLPKAYNKSKKTNNPNPNTTNLQTPSPNSILRFGHWILELGFGFLEILVFIPQYLYMKRKITNEKVGWGYAFFHPARLSGKVLKKFETRLLKYTGK